MARRFGKFNPRQKRDSHGRWTKGSSAGSKIRSAAGKTGRGAKSFGKYLVTPRAPGGNTGRNGKPLSGKQKALRIGLALAPLAIPVAVSGLRFGGRELDTLIQSATHNRIVKNAAMSQANYDRMKRAATTGLKVGQSSLKYARKSRGAYKLTDFR